MKVTDILSASTKAYPSLEIVPPMRGMTKTELLESIAPFMEFRPKYINVTSHRDEYEFKSEADGSFSATSCATASARLPFVRQSWTDMMLRSFRT